MIKRETGIPVLRFIFAEKGENAMSLRIPYEEMRRTIEKAMLAAGVPEQKAAICAEVHTSSSADGVESHGLNRVPRFLEYVRKGMIDVTAEPEITASKGAVERIDGHRGIGVTNALFAADRAVQLAKVHGIGCVALINTTHWMRGGTYAHRMAEQGYVGASWICTENVMPLWGSDVQSVGNNPLCIGIPRSDSPVLLDMAMSQYAYGKLDVYEKAGRQTEYPCGFDGNGQATCDPGTVLKTRRIMPTGYWKGSGLSLALDLVGLMLGNGKLSHEISVPVEGSCGGCTQIFVSYAPDLFGDRKELEDKVEKRLAAVNEAHPSDPKRPVQWPGEGTARRRKENLEKGIPANEDVWAQVCRLAGEG